PPGPTPGRWPSRWSRASATTTSTASCGATRSACSASTSREPRRGGRVKLGDVVHPEAAQYGKPLTGVRVLALEQMQALPYATQLLTRLGAEVVKVEAPGPGDLGRSASPAMADPDGRPVGATFMRNNLSKRSIVVDLKQPAGLDLVLRLAPR